MRVFLVEDADLIRERLIEMLRAVPGVELAGEAASVQPAISLILAARPDVVILDMQLADGSGLDVLRTLRRDAAEMVVIVLTNHAEDCYRELCLSAGARYFLDKSAQAGLLPDILRHLTPGTHTNARDTQPDEPLCQA